MNFELEIESHESDNYLDKIEKIQPCHLSVPKLVLYCFISLTIVPLIFLKWFPRIRRFLLYTFCSLEEATHFYIQGPGKFNIKVDNLFDIIKIQIITQSNPQCSIKVYYKISIRNSFIDFSLINLIKYKTKFCLLNSTLRRTVNRSIQKCQ